MKIIALVLLLIPAICLPSNLIPTSEDYEQLEQRTVWYKLKWKKYRPFPGKKTVIHFLENDTDYGNVGVNLNMDKKVMIRYRVKFK